MSCGLDKPPAMSGECVSIGVSASYFAHGTQASSGKLSPTRT